MTSMLREILRPAFNPAKLPNLALWLDAASYGTFTLSSNRVSQWNDKSGKGNHVVQATGGLQPLYVASAINGMPAVQFYDDSTVKQLARADNTTLDYTTFSCFVVFTRLTSTGGNERIVGKFSTTTPLNQREFSMLIAPGGNFQCATSSNGTTADGLGTTTSTVALSTPQICDAVVTTPYASATAARARRNNDAASQALGSVPGLFAGTASLTIGSIDGPSQHFAGYIGEILFYRAALSDAQRQKVLRYLSRKWGITLPLP